MFTGIYCETKISFCSPETCFNNGTCQPDSSDGFRCVCSKGFTGRRCETEVDECASVPCHNEGFCINIPGGYECQCKFPFDGPRCETTLCTSELSDTCQNGNCVMNSSGSGSFRCECAAGFKGTFCDETIDQCSDQSCNNHGLCVSDIGTYQCLCIPGWTGKNCDIQLDQCYNNRCQNGARCQMDTDSNDYTCQCPEGYGGRYCGLLHNHCEASPCVHGICVSRESDYICVCEEGWLGTKCSQLNCSSLTCFNGGECAETALGPECRCPEDWYGLSCEKLRNPCHNEPCRNGGICRMVQTAEVGFECLCSPDYGGCYCEYHLDDCRLSQGIKCFNGGTCVDTIANFTCLCSQQFTGWRCDIPLNNQSFGSALHTNPSVLLTTPPTAAMANATATTIKPTTVQPHNAVSNNTITNDSYTIRSSPLFTGLLFEPEVSETLSSAFVSADLRSTYFSGSLKSEQLLVSTDFIFDTPTPTIYFLQDYSPTSVSTMSMSTMFSSLHVYPTSLPPQAAIGELMTSVLKNSVNIPVPFDNFSILRSPVSTVSTNGELFLTMIPLLNDVKYSSSLPFPAHLSSYIPVMSSVSYPVLYAPFSSFSTSSSFQSLFSSVFPYASEIVIVHKRNNTAENIHLTDTSTLQSSTATSATMRLPETTTAPSPRVLTMIPSAASIPPLCPKELCHHGGVCYISSTSMFQCNCGLPFYGSVCENEMLIWRPTFTGKSLLRYAGVALAPGEALQVSIRFGFVDIAQYNATMFSAVASRNPSFFSELYLDSANVVRFHGGCGEGFIIEGNVTISVPPRAFTTVTFRHVFPTRLLPTCSVTMRSERASFSRSYTVLQIAEKLRNTTEIDHIFLGGHALARKSFSGAVSNFALQGNENNFQDDPLDGINVLPTLLDTCSALKPCRNNGTCLESYSGWMCFCLPGFTGSACELTTCMYNPCVGGSTCVQHSSDTVSCVCPLGRYGKYCEKTYDMDNDMKFFGNALNYSSYISFAPIRNASHHLEITLNITFSSMPVDMDSLDGSLLLLIGSPDLVLNGYDFFLIGLRENVPVLVYNLGGGALLTIGSGPLDVNISEHTLHMYFDSDEGTFMNINNAEPRPKPFPAEYDFRTFDSASRVFVGGYDTMDTSSPLPGFHAFTGSITAVRFRTTKAGDFVGFTNLLDGRNVLPSKLRCTSAALDRDNLGCDVSMDSPSVLVNITISEEICTRSANGQQCSPHSVCVPDASVSSYHCDCPVGNLGKHCEKTSIITNARFNGRNSYLKFDSMTNLRDRSAVEMQINPTGPNGMLFYTAEYPTSRTVEFLTLFLVNWTVTFRFNVGTAFAKALIAKVFLDKETWSSVLFGRNSSLAWLTVNSITITADLSNQTQKHLDTFTEIHIGGVPDFSTIAASAVYGLPQSFDGCIRHVIVNGKRLYLDSAGRADGLNVEGCEEPLCHHQTCENGGICRETNAAGPDNAPLAYVCECPKEFYGKHCEYAVCLDSDNTSRQMDNMTFATQCACRATPDATGMYCKDNITLADSGYFDGVESLLVMRDSLYDTSNKSSTFISFRFRTTSEDGLMMWTGKVRTPHSDYLGIGVTAGYVMVVWNLGWNSRGVLLSPQLTRVDDGEWHYVVVGRLAQQLQVILDFQMSVNGTSPGSYMDLETDGIYYLGSFPNGHKIQDETLNYFSRPFKGCLGDLTLGTGRKPVPFSQAIGNTNVLPCDKT